ncbi:putative proline-rich receptor-like protein kinase PERK5 [Cocos nucifera]|uniref:non-specific serine/threonine protein kinase n=1 Tax=Cocos nucifera TaxID=13894 RepID=A0A8K0ICA2_COCNU|nr:putative proline-rich receptor-like protein kinase PERK5 [Cocos nucifera]
MEAALQALIAAVVAFFAVFLLFSLILLLCPRTPKFHLRPLVPPTLPLPLRQPPSTSVIANESASFNPSLDHISLNELAAVTKGFVANAIIGNNNFECIYRAHLSSGTTVAVKRLSTDAFHDSHEFHAEMETLGRLRHPHLTYIVRYCISGANHLIYELLKHSSLDHWLHESDSCDSTGSVSSLPLMANLCPDCPWGCHRPRLPSQVPASDHPPRHQIEQRATRRQLWGADCRLRAGTSGGRCFFLLHGLQN